MALIWAPRNSMNCLVFIFFRPFHVEFPILGFVALYVGWEIVMAGLTDFQMSSAMLHLAGALPGFVVAAVMLKLGLVDCENWDIFAVLGNPVRHSFSPWVHGMALKGARLDAVYIALELESFDGFLELVGDENYRGFSITAPFKEAAFAAVDEHDEASRAARIWRPVSRASESSMASKHVAAWAA